MSETILAISVFCNGVIGLKVIGSLDVSEVQVVSRWGKISQ